MFRVKLPRNPWALAFQVVVIFAVVALSSLLGLFGPPTRDDVLVQCGMLIADVLLAALFGAFWVSDQVKASARARFSQEQRS